MQRYPVPVQEEPLDSEVVLVRYRGCDMMKKVSMTRSYYNVPEDFDVPFGHLSVEINVYIDFYLYRSNLANDRRGTATSLEFL